jgi:MFS family permease
MTGEPTTRSPPAHGLIVASRVLVGIEVAATLVASALFLWLLFDPKRDRWGLIFLWIGHAGALAIGVVLGLVPSLLIDRSCGVRFGRRSRLAAICIGVLLLELGVAALLPWQAVC